MAHPLFQDKSFHQLARRAAAKSSYGSQTRRTIAREAKAWEADLKAWRIHCNPVRERDAQPGDTMVRGDDEYTLTTDRGWVYSNYVRF